MTAQRDYSLIDAFGQSTAGLTLPQKAFQELEGLNRFLQTTTPPLAIMLFKRAHEVIDQYIDRAEDDKESLKAMIVIQFGYPFLFNNAHRFKDMYGQHVSDMADNFLQNKPTADALQMELALSVANLENNLELLAAPETRQALWADSGGLSARMKYLDDAFAQFSSEPHAASAPRLLQRLQEISNACKVAMVAPLPDPSRPTNKFLN